MQNAVRALLTIAGLVLWTLATSAQSPKPAPATQKPGMTPRPPVLFSETWRLPPHTGEQTDENMRVTPAVVTNPRLDVKLYGPDSRVIRASIHDVSSVPAAISAIIRASTSCLAMAAA